MLAQVKNKQREHRKPIIRSVKFNVVMNMILTSSSFIFPLITVPYASRVLGTSGVGAVAFAQSIINYCSLFAVMGISVYGVRECAKIRDDRQKLSKTVQELLIILFCTTSIIYFIFLVALFTVPSFTSQKQLMLIFSFGIWLISFGVDWFYQAIEQYGYITVRNIAFKFLSLLLMFILVHKQSDYRMYGLITVVASYGSNILNILRLRNYISFKKSGKWEFKKHFRPMLNFTVSNISSGLYSQIDIVMLGLIGTTSMVGIYQLAFKIKNVLGTAIGSVASVMLPRLSYFKKVGKGSEFNLLLAKNFSFIFATGCSLMSICIICSKEIVLLMGGSQFLDSAFPLIVISPVLIFSPFNLLLTQYMVAQGKEKICARVDSMTLILSLLLSFVLIHEFKVIGAAFSIVVAEFGSMIVRIFLARDFCSYLVSETKMYRTAVACVLATCGATFIHLQIFDLQPVPQLGITVVAYGLILITLLFVFHDYFVSIFLEPIFAKFYVKKTD
ncbi:flippase [Bifidobacterium sp.]|uniref:flippase n=1 Tax=Bifidobacterium sp. TaxID=41200 RepID=UPI0039E88E3D